MKIRLLISLSLLMFNTCQNITRQLNKINTVEQAEAFIGSNSKNLPRLFNITTDSDTSEITAPLFGKSPGFTFSIGEMTYKILKVDSSVEFRASYIYLDGSKLTLSQIDSLRKIILNKFKSGIDFANLVTEYTMDGNPTGDTGWFTENMMMPEFEKAVQKNKLNNIFTVDIPSNKWYYVALKTHDNRQNKKLTILKVRNII